MNIVNTRVIKDLGTTERYSCPCTPAGHTSIGFRTFFFSLCIFQRRCAATFHQKAGRKASRQEGGSERTLSGTVLHKGGSGRECFFASVVAC